MRKIFLLVIVLILPIGNLVFAQEGNSNGLGSLHGGFGYQMNLTKFDVNSDFIMSHGLKFLACYNMLSVNDDIGLGLLFTGRFSFPKEIDWISPDTGNVNKINSNYIYDFGVLVGASLHGKIIGPLYFGFGAGLFFNYVSARMDSFFTLLYGNVELDYNIMDLGFGLNTGLKFKIGQFILEIGSDFTYSFFKHDSYTYTSEYNHIGIIKSDSISSVASIFRISPYIIIGGVFL